MTKPEKFLTSNQFERSR